MNETNALALATLGVAALTVLLKMQAVELWTVERMKGWQSRRPKRQLVRRVSEEELQRILTSEREELETLCLLLLREYQADRVTVVEYEFPKTGLVLATCTVEERTPWMYSVRAGLQKAEVLPTIWSEVQRIHTLDCRCLYVPNARLLDHVALRAALLKTGVTTAYYQTLPGAPGHCAALLSISWKAEVPLDAEALAALHFSGRTLAAVLRSVWAWQTTES